MKLTQYLTSKEVLDLHERTIKKHGGSHGVRDQGLVESALYRAQSGYYESLSQQAAALLQSFCMNHAFVDVNKRIALLVTAVFLKMNGYSLQATNEEFVNFILNDVITKKTEVNELAVWIESKMKSN